MVGSSTSLHPISQTMMEARAGLGLFQPGCSQVHSCLRPVSPHLLPSKRALGRTIPTSSRLSEVKVMCATGHEWDGAASTLAVVTKEPRTLSTRHARCVLRHHATLLTQPTTTTTLKFPSLLQMQRKGRATICPKRQNQGPRRQTQMNDAQLFSSRSSPENCREALQIPPPSISLFIL